MGNFNVQSDIAFINEGGGNDFDSFPQESTING
jgi:hypothetical protein